MVSTTLHTTAAPVDRELSERSASFQPAAQELASRSRTAFRSLRASPLGARNRALLELAERLGRAEVRAAVIAENNKDIAAAESHGVRGNLVDRLRLSEARLDEIRRALTEIAGMSDPLGEVTLGRTLPNGIDMLQKRTPLGVVFVIYESRPNVTVDVGALCIKSGNAAILRGGREALHSNLMLFRLFQESLAAAGLPPASIELVQEPDRAFMLALLREDRLIDLVVPRGGEQLIQFISANSRIPVIKHDRGVCNLYIDRSADFERALNIAVNAKLQRTSVCNTIENLLIHADFPRAAELLQGLTAAGAELLGCEKSQALYAGVKPIVDADLEYSTEYLDERLSVKIVANVEEAVDFIYRYGSGHSEAIVAEETRVIESFQRLVDSAAVFINCSTRFHDGGQMGFGAEVGISTGRLHVRGPMGLRDLTTTTYVMRGAGQVRE